MDVILDILKFSVSGILVFLATFFVLKNLLDNREKERRHQMRIETGKILTPIKLTAYERLVLFLERIKPESMVVRIQYPTMKAGDLHLMYIQQVREEFEHNVSQQIYVSEDLWRFVIAAKESLLQFINTCSESVPNDVPAVELSKILIEKYNETENPPIDIALVVLKNEIKTLA
ncbi:MAG: hypothetical protein UH071_01215 [Paludibacteraceae bacterium]|nr:hypothetical protein [Paludibacteraceae bacterium]